jgi:putative tryptophan/tyrosine transport system substrate-binding protein
MSIKRPYLVLATCFYLLTCFHLEARADMVGALMPARNIPYYLSIQEVLEKELSVLGIRREFLVQQPAPTEMAWKNTARRMKTLGANIIIAYGNGTALAVLSENLGIPVVYCAAHDPLTNGLTGQNITGVSATVPLQGLIVNLKKISNFSRLGILYSSEENDSVVQMEGVAALGGRLGFGVVAVDVKLNPDSFTLPAAEAVLLTSSGAVNNLRSLQRIIEEARGKKMATASVLGNTADLGILISLSATAEQQGKDAAKMVATILQGNRAAQIAGNNSPNLELAINVKVAKELGVTIPFELMGAARLIN